MGQEVVCAARWSGKSVRGKALLETAEIIFRGEERRKIPFSAIRRLQAKDGELRLKTDEGLVGFELGEQAEKWRQKIANTKSGAEKHHGDGRDWRGAESRAEGCESGGVQRDSHGAEICDSGGEEVRCTTAACE